MGNLALSYGKFERHADALKMHIEVVQAYRFLLPRDHADTFAHRSCAAQELFKLNRGADAVAVINELVADGAGKTIDLTFFRIPLGMRSRYFQSLRDPKGCRVSAEMWDQFGLRDAESLYFSACKRALAAELYAEAYQSHEATADADRAAAWLAKAVDAGYTDRAKIEKDDSLTFLRGRPDFEKLVASLPAATPQYTAGK